MAAKKKIEPQAALIEEAVVEEAVLEAVVAEETLLQETVGAESIEVEAEVSAEAAVEGTEVFSTDEIEPPAKEALDLTDYYDDDEPLEKRERKITDFTGSKLTWLVDDFVGLTSSVYEAVMVASHRARQVGRQQKHEIDSYNSSQVLSPESIEAEEHAEKGIDHFQHIKPTIVALNELKEQSINYYFLEPKK